MARGDLEDVKAAIADWLRSSRLADKLTAIDVEKNDGLQSEPFKFVYDYERALPEGWPAAMLLGLNSAYSDETEAKDSVIQVEVALAVVGSDESVVTRQLQRLTRAVRDLLWGSPLDGSVQMAPIMVTGEDYGMLVPGVDGTGALMKAAKVRLAIRTITD
jgi:hypothetical protein